MGKFLKVLMKKLGCIQGCSGPSDHLTSFGEIVVKRGSVCFLFGPRNTLTRNDKIYDKSWLCR